MNSAILPHCFLAFILATIMSITSSPMSHGGDYLKGKQKDYRDFDYQHINRLPFDHLDGNFCLGNPQIYYAWTWLGLA